MWRKQPPTADEVRRGMTRWWQRGIGQHAPRCPDLLFLDVEDDGRVTWKSIEDTHGGVVDPAPFGEWAPCISPPISTTDVVIGEENTDVESECARQRAKEQRDLLRFFESYFGIKPDNDTAVSRNGDHARLLDEGWYPIRWRHPEHGDVELTSVGFWLNTDHFGGGALMGSSEQLDALLKDGRNFFKRDAQGNMLIVTAKEGGMELAEMMRRAQEERGTLK